MSYTESARKCWTCDHIVDDSTALACTRPYCQGRREAEKDAKSNPKPAPEPQYHDAYGGGGGGFVLGGITTITIGAGTIGAGGKGGSGGSGS